MLSWLNFQISSFLFLCYTIPLDQVGIALAVKYCLDYLFDNLFIGMRGEKGLTRVIIASTICHGSAPCLIKTWFLWTILSNFVEIIGNLDYWHGSLKKSDCLISGVHENVRSHLMRTWHHILVRFLFGPLVNTIWTFRLTV